MDYINLSPQSLADERIKLATEYSRMAEQLSEILALKPSIWLTLRSNSKSDTSAERAWENTPQGITEAQLHLKMKASDRMQSALSSRLRIAEAELRHIL